ncbi:hypothetical protein [Streptosporangium sp. NPDC000396]|uniref:hypothetical protein n=1 Tax=Streptosporangium sp. NPDC000396 TaxID=3366185 RepID=UPI00368E75AF
MTWGPRDGVVIDAHSRSASGHAFGKLADEHADFVAGLRSEWGEEAPLPYEEFSGPYLRLRRNLLDECERLGANLRHVGDGQVVMAERNREAERASTMRDTPAGLFEA